MTQADSQNHSIALWQQLQSASDLFRDVRAGRSLTALLGCVNPALRPGAQALVFHVLRWAGTAQALRQRLVPRSPPPPVEALLCTALALMLPRAGAPYTDFTLVDQAVEAAKRSRHTRAQSGLVNGCLRAFLRSADALVREVQENDIVARWNLPAWWIERLQADHPAHWPAIVRAAQQRAAMVLRVNATQMTPPEYQAHLHEHGMHARSLGAAALELAHPVPVSELPGFEQGWVSVQSASAQLAAPLLIGAGLSPRPRILDACAAPGGKTAHVLELCPDAHVVALDIDAARCERIESNLARLGVRERATLKVADAAQTAQWWDGEPFDAILIDAPCSASGIVNRHPDVPWLRRESDLPQLAGQQDQLLNSLWPLLKPGGRLVYSTCSVFRIEGEQRVEAFVARNTNAALKPSPGHILPIVPGDGASGGDNRLRDDGFFYALLEKRVG